MTNVASVLDGNRLALARLLTQVENDTTEGRSALDELFPYAGQAHLIGVTGAPGTGKSSLVSQLARLYRQPVQEVNGDLLPARRVAIVAIDPSSPFSGGAILGDRVRMRDLAGDPGVFIRSMASRGALGGISRTTAGVVQVLDAAGYEIILIETVGAGQAEVDIARLAHTTLVVEAPGLGDDIQAIKAGILEIADVIVINKADRPGVEATERALQGMLQLAHPTQRVFRHHGRMEALMNYSIPDENGPVWIPPIQKTVATEGTGVPDLIYMISRHLEYLHTSGGWQQRERTRLQAELDEVLQATVLARWRETISDDYYQDVLQKVIQRQFSPWQAVAMLVKGGAY